MTWYNTGDRVKVIKGGPLAAVGDIGKVTGVQETSVLVAFDEATNVWIKRDRVEPAPIAGDPMPPPGGVHTAEIAPFPVKGDVVVMAADDVARAWRDGDEFHVTWADGVTFMITDNDGETRLLTDATGYTIATKADVPPPVVPAAPPFKVGDKVWPKDEYQDAVVDHWNTFWSDEVNSPPETAFYVTDVGPRGHIRISGIPGGAGPCWRAEYFEPDAPPPTPSFADVLDRLSTVEEIARVQAESISLLIDSMELLAKRPALVVNMPPPSPADWGAYRVPYIGPAVARG